MKQRILFIASQPMSVIAFMLPHIRALESFFDVHVMANNLDRALLQQHGADINVQPVAIVRPISLIADLKVLWILYWRFKHGNFSAVHTITPKAGLLGMFAAWAARVPVRIHSFTGQVWVTRIGLMRWLLRTMDKVTSALATDVLVDSPSQRNFLIDQRIVSVESSRVLGAGSICGVDTQRFSPNVEVRHAQRAKLGTSDDALVCLYLGRLNRDKGVLDLAAAFARVATAHPKAELWIVGPDEGDFFGKMSQRLVGVMDRVKRIDYTHQPERFMQAADFFCLPSYREGFGSSVIEAAACGVPTLASRIYGLTDAVVEGKTGWLHEAGNVQDLASQLNALLQDPAEILRKGRAARVNALQVFEQSLVTSAMFEFYKARLKAADAKDA